VDDAAAAAAAASMWRCTGLPATCEWADHESKIYCCCGSTVTADPRLLRLHLDCAWLRVLDFQPVLAFGAAAACAPDDLFGEVLRSALFDGFVGSVGVLIGVARRSVAVVCADARALFDAQALDLLWRQREELLQGGRKRRQARLLDAGALRLAGLLLALRGGCTKAGDARGRSHAGAALS